MGHVSGVTMSRGKNSLWRHHRLLKVTTETSWTFFFGGSVAFAVYARFQMFKSFWLCCLWFMARVCPAFCLWQEENGWHLFGLHDLFVDVFEGCVPVYTSLLEGYRKRASWKNAAKLSPLPSSLNSIKESGVRSEAALTPSAMGSRTPVLGQATTRSCALMRELAISAWTEACHNYSNLFPRPQDWRPVPWAGALLLPRQAAHLPWC